MMLVKNQNQIFVNSCVFVLMEQNILTNYRFLPITRDTNFKRNEKRILLRK